MSGSLTRQCFSELATVRRNQNRVTGEKASMSRPNSLSILTKIVYAFAASAMQPDGRSFFANPLSERGRIQLNLLHAVQESLA